MTAPILVLADIHLGRPQSGAKKTGPGIEWALEALQRGAQAGAGHMVMLGDVIDRSRFTSATFDEVTRFFARAVELFDTTVFVAGNHDVHHDLTSVIPPGVAVAGTRPQTICAGGWTLHTAAVEVDRDPRRLVPSFPSRIDAAPNLGLLHTSVTGEYSNNACLPCDVAELEACDYDAWALGHVHQRIALDAAVPVGWVGMGRGLIATLDDAHVTLRDL
ncbi:metallophosphoesterase [Corynebacterium hadale]